MGGRDLCLVDFLVSRGSMIDCDVLVYVRATLMFDNDYHSDADTGGLQVHAKNFSKASTNVIKAVATVCIVGLTLP